MIPTESEKQAALAFAEWYSKGNGGGSREIGVLAAALRQAEAELGEWREAFAHVGNVPKEVVAIYDAHGKKALAAALDLSLRLSTSEAELAALRLKPDGNHDRCGAGMRSRLKTLEEENARIREIVKTNRVFLQRLDDLGGLGLMVHDAIRAEIDNIDAALKQEAE